MFDKDKVVSLILYCVLLEKAYKPKLLTRNADIPFLLETVCLLGTYVAIKKIFIPNEGLKIREIAPVQSLMVAPLWT